jgi:hypothetical protein
MLNVLKGRHFDDIDDIRSNTTAALKDIPQNQFQNFKLCDDGTLTQVLCFWTLSIVFSLSKNRPVYI